MLYLHIPFCKQACHYCDFHFSTSLKYKTALVNALCRELEMRKGGLTEPLESIYFGGGTPSLLTAGELGQLFDTIYKHYRVAHDPEITLEANPDDLLGGKLADYYHLPVNRLSIGIQSFFDEDLRLMNRAHDAIQAHRCISFASTFFSDISIDLIYGIPGLSGKRWRDNLDIALSYSIPHVSCYALTVEPNTALEKFIEKGKVPPPDEALCQKHFRTLTKVMAKNGYIHYELSNFGREGFFSRNNRGYWSGKKYLGIGPAAHSYDGKKRSWNVRSNHKYIQGVTNGILPSESETLSKRDRYNERIMTGLRTMNGVSIRDIEKAFGQRYRDEMLSQAKKHIQSGLLRVEKDTLLVTKSGKFLTDGLSSDLFLV